MEFYSEDLEHLCKIIDRVRSVKKRYDDEDHNDAKED